MGDRSFPHLPAGHEPGIQSLRAEGGSRFWGWASGLVGSGMAVSGIFVAAGGRGPEFDRLEEGLGGAFFASMGLVCALWGYAQLRGPRSARLKGVRLGVGHEVARRGDALTVTLTLAGDAGRAPDDERLEVGLVCAERYDHRVRVQHRGGVTYVRRTAEATAHEEWRELGQVTGEATFTFVVPPEAAYSYEGECVSYAWRASARVARRLRPDSRIDHPIWVEA